MDSGNNINKRDRVLLVEDDKDIVGLLEIHLLDMGCELIISYNGRKGLEKARAETFDLIILDIMLPGMNGTEICKTLRAEDDHTPVFMLSAKAEKYDKMIGMEYGADAYMTKPFRIIEFISQVKSLLCKVGGSKALSDNCEDYEEVLDYGNLKLNVRKKELYMDGKTVELSCKEFDILCLLASEPGRSYSRNQIYDLVWGLRVKEYAHVVNSHINRLRSKIEPNFQSPTYILTTVENGYFFNPGEHYQRKVV